MELHAYLKKIIDAKKQDVDALHKTIGIDGFKAQVFQKFPQLLDDVESDFLQDVEGVNRNFEHEFYKALSQPGLRLIAEIKKASPSKGVIRENFEPKVLAEAFESGGAAALSVLTEVPHFQGHPAYIAEAKSVCSLPVLRKDFIIDPIQVFEAKIMGADAILLIKTLLTNDELETLALLANTLRMDVLIEVHDENELGDVYNRDFATIIGINNRNLTTFETDINRSRDLKQILDKQRFKGLTVAESGYQSGDDMKVLSEQGFSAVLVGEGLAKFPEMLDYFSR